MSIFYYNSTNDLFKFTKSKNDINIFEIYAKIYNTTENAAIKKTNEYISNL